MTQILAVILVCAATTAQPACTRDTALDVMTVPTPSLLSCIMAGQASIAQADLLGDGRYAKVLCGARR